jgi:Rad3-related DNA helicase
MFREGRDAEQNTEVTQRYRRVATGVGGAVLLCVFRGRNSEGSNFPDDQARGIFLVGVPYANYGDPLVKEQIRYFNGQKRGLGNRWYTMDAFRAANQSLGRGIRSRTDWCHYWLLDRRYNEHRNLVSEWAKLGGVEIVSEHKPKFSGFKRLSEA